MSRRIAQRVFLVHWNAVESKQRAELLRQAGYDVIIVGQNGDWFRNLKENPPEAMVIDMSRLPSHGRDVALMVRQQKSTRRLPLVFVDGDPVKMARVRQLLPDAVYASWTGMTEMTGIGASLKRAIAHPPAEPVVPASALAGYSGTPLPKKLGIKPGCTVALAGAPSGFPSTLGALPDKVKLVAGAKRRSDLTVWFVRTGAELSRGIGAMAERAPAGGLWIAWPKKTSAMAADLTQARVRQAGLAAGLVDYKICAIDDTWSGLKFARRRSMAP
ncbi:MAG TPA: hypothetical protein VFE84_14190 [Patescibacteria group bacterium]|nr:hypothetical protein [Patescibacteria group bacterium]